MDVRAVRLGEGARLREFRLRALDDAPRAYYWNRATEEAITAEEWEQWADTLTGDRIMFVAEQDGDWVGMAGCSLRADGSGVLDATGMWVAPGARGQSLGERLIEAITAWGRTRGATTMEFAVTEKNDVAITLYRRLGFTPTGKRRALASNPGLTGIFMSKPI